MAECEFTEECKADRRASIERREADAEFKGTIKKGLDDLEATASRIERSSIEQIGSVWKEINGMKKILYPLIGVIGIMQVIIGVLLAKMYI